MKRRDIIKLMLSNEFDLIRQSGSHWIFKKDNRIISIASHNKKPIHRNVVLRELKKFNTLYYS